MQVLIKDRYYDFAENALDNADTRKRYFELAHTVYGLAFDKWYDAGHCDGRFIPYVLYDEGLAVSSVAVCLNDVSWQGSTKRYIQISTVMTLPAYRQKGLSRWLMDHVLAKWRDQCDAIYLLANDRVVDFYPKFGFEEFTEYDFTLPVQKIEGTYRKLDINDPDDLKLIIRKYHASNPFTALKVTNLSQFLFHCVQFVSGNLYYIEAFDAVAIIGHEGEKMICYDVFADSGAHLSGILGVLSNEDTAFAYLGFTPQLLEGCLVSPSQEEDNHLFVLSGKENIFKDHQVMFPLLSRA